MKKIGVLLMGKRHQSPKRVKEVILEVEGKTQMKNILQYLLEMQKIANLNVSIHLQKNGEAVGELSTISQSLKYAVPIDGVLKLYLYENSGKDESLTNLLPEVSVIKSEISMAKPIINEVVQTSNSKEVSGTSKFCCC